MEIRNIITFLKVAELQSFTNAAKQLGYSQAAVTIQIRQLEEELNTQLFNRIGKHINLTESGEEFIPYATRVLKATDDAKAFTYSKAEPEGELRLLSISSLSIGVLTPVLMQFRALCPKVKTSLQISDYYMGDLLNMVRKNDVDLLYFIDKRIEVPEWVKVAERPEPVVFVASAQNPLASAGKVSFEQIIGEPFIETTKSSSYTYDLEQILRKDDAGAHTFLKDSYELESLFKDQYVNLRTFLRTGSTEVIIKLVRSNAGISFLPQYVVQEYIDSGELAIIDADYPDPYIWSQLVYHKNKWVTPQMEIFISLMQQYLNPIEAER